jgi:hypothetical protein
MAVCKVLGNCRLEALLRLLEHLAVGVLRDLWQYI